MRISSRDLSCVLCLTVAMGVASVSAQGRSTGAAAADPELQKLADEFVQAWAKGDAKAIAALHTEDAIRIPGDGQVITGRAAIEKSFAEGLSGMWKGSKLTITPGKSTPLAPNVQVAEGRYQLTDGTPPAGAPTSGQYLNTVVRKGGRWLLASAAIIPPPPPQK
jgi:uncharacterized protein (TIGR02246 family)